MCLQSHKIRCADKTCFCRPGHKYYNSAYIVPVKGLCAVYEAIKETDINIIM